MELFSPFLAKMLLNKWFCLIFILLTTHTVQLNARFDYNFSYQFRGSTHGKILLIIPFRVYYESFASVNFSSEKNANGGFDFYFSDISESGYMMRTSGFLGKTLVVLTADYDLKKGLKFAFHKLKHFYEPYYSKFIKRKKPFLFRIYSTKKNSMGFRRNSRGIHSHFFIDFNVRFQHHPEILNIDFNIYKILLEMLKVYNHSFLPGKKIETLIKRPRQEWKSSLLNYSSNINRVVVLAARIMKKLKPLKQTAPFRIHYRVSNLTPSIIEVTGISKPGVPIWGRHLIKEVTRKIRIRLKDRILLEDTFTLTIENPQGNGLQARTSLQLKN